MKSRDFIYAIVLCAAVTASGCGGTGIKGPDSEIGWFRGVTAAGADQIIGDITFSTFDENRLIAMIDPENKSDGIINASSIATRDAIKIAAGNAIDKTANEGERDDLKRAARIAVDTAAGSSTIGAVELAVLDAVDKKVSSDKRNSVNEEVSKAMDMVVNDALAKAAVKAKSEAAKPAEDYRLESAMYYFYKYDTSSPDIITRRNMVQDRLISASENRCGLYKKYLKRMSSNTGFFLGSATTILGGAGAIVTDSVSARILSGIAGITSGVNAEFNKQYFSEVATNVIIPGIDIARKKVMDEIKTNRTGDTDAKTYTLNAAIADALRYHAACTIDSGLNEARERISKDISTLKAAGSSNAWEKSQAAYNALNAAMDASTVITGNSSNGWYSKIKADVEKISPQLTAAKAAMDAIKMTDTLTVVKANVIKCKEPISNAKNAIGAVELKLEGELTAAKKAIAIDPTLVKQLGDALDAAMKANANAKAFDGYITDIIEMK